MNSDKFFALFGKIIIVLAVIGVIAFGAYYLGKQSTQKQEEHGQPITSQKTEISTIPIQNTQIVAVTSVSSPTTDETDALKTAIKEALVSKHGSSAESLTISVSKIQNGYASGGASGSGGGGMWFAAKEGGVWKLVWDGNGSILCSDLASYPNFPSSMIGECWNDQTQKMVNR